MTGASPPHVSVMLREVVVALAPAAGQVYIDGTFGAGGYTKAILDAADCRVIAIDRDATAIARAGALRQQYDPRLMPVQGRFSDIESIAGAAGWSPLGGLVLDIGVSSMQIDQAERGFSFRFDGPLDMRMDTGGGPTAADLVNKMPEEELARIIYEYGEERHSRRIARAIVAARDDAPFKTTAQLADLVRSVVPRGKKDLIDRATRTFQALRIAVNDELGELERVLHAAERLLPEGGRLVVVTFHSLEDRIVKKFMQERSGNTPSPSRHVPVAGDVARPTFTLASRKPLEPQPDETASNPRARSARLRAAIRTAAPAWPEPQPSVKPGRRGS